MAKNINQIAVRLGAKIVTRVPEVDGGAFGAARLAKILEALQARPIPSHGKRVDRGAFK